MPMPALDATPQLAVSTTRAPPNHPKWTEHTQAEQSTNSKGIAHGLERNLDHVGKWLVDDDLVQQAQYGGCHYGVEQDVPSDLQGSFHAPSVLVAVGSSRFHESKPGDGHPRAQTSDTHTQCRQGLACWNARSWCEHHELKRRSQEQVWHQIGKQRNGCKG